MLPQVVTVPQKQVQYRKRDKLPAHGDIYPKQKNRTYSTETDTQSSLIVTYFIISRTWDRRPESRGHEATDLHSTQGNSKM